MGDRGESHSRAALARFGYDPDDPVRGRPVPYKLLRAIEEAPLVPESFLGHNVSMAAARRFALDKLHRTL